MARLLRNYTKPKTTKPHTAAKLLFNWWLFSHSDLGVGWDNPNVFNIATLNATRSEDKKRQELGRGLRICVNQHGQREYDPPDTPLGQEINLLTVVPN